MSLGARNLLLTVLSTTATKREARQYIQKYGPLALKKRVSLVRVSGHQGHLGLNANHGPELGRTLAYMKELGAYPIVVIDGSPQINHFLGKSPLPMREYEDQLHSLGEKLSSYIGNSAQPTILSTPFELSVKDGVQVKSDWLEQSLAAHKTPVLLPFTYDIDTNETKLWDSYAACSLISRNLRDPFILDKLIFVDPVGGLPSQRRKHAAHVLVNLMQEYGDISAEIRGSTYLDKAAQESHLLNLNAMNEILGQERENDCTGLITDPSAAGRMLDANPLIYNLLTDRPLISPSLPMDLERTQLRTSVLRTGFPVYVRHNKESGLDLRREAKVGNVNLTKLEILLEASFRRKIDMDHYLNRLAGNVAAFIIVGDYDGVAIITWETSQLTGRRLAYLDKFAVDPGSQGAQGVADIMLIQMIRRLFPEEMVWRSRKTNPVNKWYFERSRGHMNISDSQWIMFWISQDRVPPVDEYESVCRNIEPSLL